VRSAANGRQRTPDDSNEFFRDTRSSNVDDVLSGKITYDEYFDGVDRRAREYIRIDHNPSNLLRTLAVAASILWILIFIAFITITIISFRGSGNTTVRWLSSSTSFALAGFATVYLIRTRTTRTKTKPSKEERSK